MTQWNLAECLDPFRRATRGSEGLRLFARGRAPSFDQRGFGEEAFHFPSQRRRISRAEFQSVHVLIHEVVSRAHHVRANDWQPRTDGLIHHDAPAIVAARQYENIRLSKEARQFLRRLETRIDTAFADIGRQGRE